uniref:Uncharacterized protein n=1 Tax=Arundo donax TaxID=35708 RepID=A0A0A9EMP2_ARUDO
MSSWSSARPAAAHLRFLPVTATAAAMPAARS